MLHKLLLFCIPRKVLSSHEPGLTSLFPWSSCCFTLRLQGKGFAPTFSPVFYLTSGQKASPHLTTTSAHSSPGCSSNESLKYTFGIKPCVLLSCLQIPRLSFLFSIYIPHVPLRGLRTHYGLSLKPFQASSSQTSPWAAIFSRSYSLNSCLT